MGLSRLVKKITNVIAKGPDPIMAKQAEALGGGKDNNVESKQAGLSAIDDANRAKAEADAKRTENEKLLKEKEAGARLDEKQIKRNALLLGGDIKEQYLGRRKTLG